MVGGRRPEDGGGRPGIGDRGSGSERLQPYDFHFGSTGLHSHPCHARLQVETLRAGRAGIDDQSWAGTLHQRLVSMPKDDDILSVACQKPFGCRTTELVAVADVDGHTLDVELLSRFESRLTRWVGIAIDRPNRRDGRQLVNDRAPADVA